jgi:hypothetical protein
LQLKEQQQKLKEQQQQQQDAHIKRLKDIRSSVADFEQAMSTIFLASEDADANEVGTIHAELKRLVQEARDERLMNMRSGSPSEKELVISSNLYQEIIDTSDQIQKSLSNFLAEVQVLSAEKEAIAQQEANAEEVRRKRTARLRWKQLHDRVIDVANMEADAADLARKAIDSALKIAKRTENGDGRPSSAQEADAALEAAAAQAAAAQAAAAQAAAAQADAAQAAGAQAAGASDAADAADASGASAAGADRSVLSTPVRNLLDQIKQGKTLKKVVVPVKPNPNINPSTEGSALARLANDPDSTLAKAMRERRKSVIGAEIADEMP